MIFRRIASSLKKQDWFVVAIEFALIIASVLLALQVNNWNEARRWRLGVQGALERFDQEIAANIQIATDTENLVNESAESRNDALLAIAQCAPGEEAMAAVSLALGNSIRDFSPTFVDNSFVELLRRDEFLDLLSADFREKLAVYRGRLTEDQSQFETNFNLLWQDHVLRHPFVGANFSDASLPSPLRLVVPMEEACQDPRFQVQSMVTFSFITGLGMRATRLREATEEFREALTAEREALAR